MYYIPYRTVVYLTALYRNEYQYVARVRIIPKRVFPYDLHGVLEVPYGTGMVPYGKKPYRGHTGTYIRRGGGNSKYRNVSVQAGSPHVDKLLTGSWPKKIGPFP